MKKLARYLKPFKRQCILGPLCKLIEAILEILLPTLMALIINQGVLTQDKSFVITFGLVMIFMVFIGFGFSCACQYLAAIASQGFGTNVRNQLLKHITSFSYQDIDRFSTASLSNRLINDVNQIQLAVAMMIRLLIRAPFIILGAIFMSMLLDFTLSLILMATIPFIILILYVFIRYSSPLYQNYQKKLDHFAQLLDENFSGIRLIRAFVSQRSQKEKIENECEDLQRQMIRVSRCSALLNPLTALVVNGAILLLLWFGILQINAHNMQVGTIIAGINYATQILIALIATSNLIVIFTKAFASAQRINEVLDSMPSMKEGTKSIEEFGSTAISFDHVTFAYEKGGNTLQNLSFTIQKGETIGIIGGTGAGKTTFVNLIARFYDCDQGEIQLFNTPITSLTNTSIRNTINIVSQKNELFSDTILENITLGKAYSKEEITQALIDSQAMEFVSQLSEGLNSRLERGGTNLSGGQKQRLCIARALLKKSKILILDDSCSALDFKTEAKLRKALRKATQTTLIVSQRIGTLLDCDRILVIDEGELAGFDSHIPLYENCAIYRELCETQKISKEATL